MTNTNDKNPNKNNTGGIPFRHSLILCFALIALVSSISVGSLTYYLRSKALQQIIFTQLETMRNDRISDINSWFAERLNDIQLWSQQPGIKDSCELYKNTKNASTPDNQERLKLIRQTYNFRAVCLLDPHTGNAFLSAKNGDNESQDLPDPYFMMVLSSKKPIISDVVLNKTDRSSMLYLAAPVLSATTAEITGILIFTIDMTDMFYPVFLTKEGLGETGEIVLVNKDCIVQGPLKYSPNAITNFKIQAEPSLRAAAGLTGRIADRDYHSMPVMAAYGHINLVHWGIVVKKDIAEVNAPLVQMAWQIFFVTLFVVFISILIGGLLAQVISRPAASIAEIAESIGKGNVNLRADETGPFEIRMVARQLNMMVNQLAKQHHIDNSINVIYESVGMQDEVTGNLNAFLPKLMESTRSQLGVVYLADESGEHHFCAITRGINPSALPASIQSASPDSLLAEAIASGKIMVLQDLPDDNGFTILTQAGESKPRALLTIPLIQYSRVIAVIGLASVYNYREEDIEIAKVISQNLGQSIAVCQANEKTKRMAEELQSMNEELLQTNEELHTQSEQLQQQTSELRAQAVELEEQRAQVEESDRLKSEFLSNMSHELRTPLNSVMALSQLMISRGPGKNPVQDSEYLRIIERNGRHLLNLINDILDLSKIESGRMDVHLTELNPANIIIESIEMIRPLATDKGLMINAKSLECPLIHSDKEKVSQILVNILTNAVKFTEHGEIGIRVKSSGDTVAIAVSDTGIGIKQSDLSYIFDEFRQVDGSTTRKYEGTGLGLAICQKLAHLLGGNICVESIVGHGSIFTLNLPVAYPEVRQMKSREEKLPDAGKMPAPVALKRTILVIDDDPAICSILREYLETIGYHVLTAVNGQEGMQLAIEHHPFAITLDVLMPDLDGWEVIRQLKANPSTQTIPVIIISIAQDQETGMALGAASYIVKPVDKNLLLDEIAKIEKNWKVKHILITDDDPVVLAHLQMILSGMDYQIETATCGTEALQKAKTEIPDVIILDLIMPEVDGFAVLHHLRKDAATREIPVIILTAKDLTIADRHQLEDHVHQIIYKRKLSKEYLLKEIQSVLDRIEAGYVPETKAYTPFLLIVEDNAIATLQIRSILEENGYHAAAASGGAEALEFVKNTIPGAIILDLMMPDVDGFTVLQEIRSAKWTKNIPVLVLTAKTLTEAEREILTKNNVQQLLLKGAIDRDQLLSAVRQLFQTEPIDPCTDPVQPETVFYKEEAKTKPTILTVEDNPDNMTTLTAILEQIECSCIPATDGEEAVRLARLIQPDLILMDIQLPVLSGMDATRQIKSDPSLGKIPIIALTAKAMKGDKELILEAGFDDYIAKPLNSKELIGIIKKWI